MTVQQSNKIHPIAAVAGIIGAAFVLNGKINVMYHA